MNKNLKNKKKKGFTLIELIIVIAIIAILAVLAIPKFGEVRRNAAFKSDVANAKTIANAASSLYTEGTLPNGSYYVDGTVTDSNKIEAYLQNTTAPKSEGYVEYKVLVTNGDIKVTMTSEASGEGTSTQLFPVPETSAKAVTP